MDAMQFFQKSSGKWISQRTTHHLPFRRAEMGSSAIEVKTLAADDPRVVEICQIHEIDPSHAAGGAFVQWNGSMQWDREDDENHAGSTVFAIVPDADNPQKGKMLRERGYAEIVPVAGQYVMDEEDGLVLITEYETMSSIERFWFASDGVRMRTSTVKRFGGFSTATFCTETRIEEGVTEMPTESIPQAAKAATKPFYSSLGW
ncbi:MAG TPA: phycobiliprotein lyase [Oscillatoriales cyanobacterium M59_W2019_021]|nr:phycobiliprotein lyase [Oscillatoriales cyanobacterium M4454_W2019_049]HIK49518.1 phycobiliprotein lyase [Oscillatoriales cyanobacterium M59_W2019_021]